MFKKRKCKNCNRKIDDSYDFCPHCGQSTNNSLDWGILGKTDTINELNQFPDSMLGGMLGKMLGRTMKMLEKEIQREMKTQNHGPRTNFELIINGKRVDPKNIRVAQQPIQRKIPKQKILPSLSSESSKKISKLPKKEPLTNIRRFADKVIYELKMPSVHSLQDISIIKLENSIEIKALANKKAYFKIIPISLPIINYKFSDEKLVLELGIRN